MRLKRIAYSCVALCAVSSSYAIEPADSLSNVNDSTAHTLREVVVEAAKVRVFSDHDELTLSEENRDFGANALDAISSLPLFRTQIMGSEIKNVSGVSVNIVIDGRFASAAELSQYTGQQIKSVNYYAFTPPRYMPYCSGPLIEVKTQRKRDAFYHLAMLNNSMFQPVDKRPFNFISEYSHVGFTYMDSLNMFKFGYNYSIRDHDLIRGDIKYDYGNTCKTYTTSEGYRKRMSHNAALSYQYSNPSDLFSVLLSYNATPRIKTGMPMEAEFREGDKVSYGFRNSYNSTTQDALRMAVFYDHNFADLSKLTFNIQGSASWAKSLTGLDIRDGGGNIFTHITDVRNRVLFFMGTTTYSRKIGRGDLLVDVFSYMDNLRQRFNWIKMPDANNVRLSGNASYDIRFSDFNMSLSFGYGWNRSSAGEGNCNISCTPVGRIQLGYKINSTMSLRANATVGCSYKSLGTDYDNKYYDDENFYQQGNFDVRRLTNSNCNITYQFVTPNGKYTAGAATNIRFDRNPFFQYVLRDGTDYVQTTLNAKKYFALDESIHGSYSPTRWFEAYLSLGLEQYRNPLCPVNGEHYKSYNRIIVSGQITFMYKNFSLNADFNNREVKHLGDKTTIKYFASNVNISWRKERFFVSLTWGRNLYFERESMVSSGFSWSEFYPLYNKNVFSLNLYYSIYKGKPKRKENKEITLEAESGLMR